MDIDKLLKYDRLGRSHWWLTSKYTVLSDMVKRFYNGIAPVKMLDIGCGSGIFIEYLKQFSSNIVGLDVNHQILDILRKRNPDIKTVTADIAEKLPFKDETFDFISMIDVLEHVDDDRRLAKDISRILKQRGILFLSVPAYNALYGNHDKLYGHKRRYNRKELTDVLKVAGFVIYRATYFQPAFVIPLWIKRKLFSGVSDKDDFSILPKPINTFLHKILSMEKYFLRIFDIPFGTTLACLARKP